KSPRAISFNFVCRDSTTLAFYIVRSLSGYSKESNQKMIPASFFFERRQNQPNPAIPGGRLEAGSSIGLLSGTLAVRSPDRFLQPLDEVVVRGLSLVRALWIRRGSEGRAKCSSTSFITQRLVTSMRW